VKTIIVYSTETGFITKLVTCPDGSTVCQAGDGESIIVPSDDEMALFRQRGDAAMKVEGGVLVAHTPDKPATDGLTDYTWNETTFRWESFRTEDGLAYDARKQRDSLLSDCDWVVTKALEDGESISASWKAYRQSLRDVPLQSGFPASIAWPEKPE
jgi:hypothetical protein